MNQHWLKNCESLWQPKCSSHARGACGSPQGAHVALATPPWQGVQRGYRDQRSGPQSWWPSAGASSAPLPVGSCLLLIGITCSIRDIGGGELRTPAACSGHSAIPGTITGCTERIFQGLRTHSSSPAQVCKSAFLWHKGTRYAWYVQNWFSPSIFKPEIHSCYSSHLQNREQRQNTRHRTQNHAACRQWHSYHVSCLPQAWHWCWSKHQASLAAFSLQQGTNCFPQSWLSLHLE